MCPDTSFGKLMQRGSHRGILASGGRRRRFVALVVVGFCPISLSGCALLPFMTNVFTATNWAYGRHNLSRRGIEAQDLRDLDDGNLSAVKARYDSVGFDALTLDQQCLLCDLYAKYYEIGSALACLDSLEKRTPEGEADAIAGKRALLYLQSGEYERAAELSRGLKSRGGRYVYALAAVQLGRTRDALRVASDFGRYRDPKIAFFASNIYLALGDYSRALKTAIDPPIQLALRYGLKPHRGMFGCVIQPAVFRADIFDEFNFGFFGTFSYAPASNAYVEFIVAKALLETGRLQEAKERFDIIIDCDRVSAFRDVYWMSLFERGRLAEMEGNVDAAMDLYREAIDLIEAIRSSIHTDLGRMGFVADKQKVYGRLITLLIRSGQNRLALEYIERARCRTLVDLLSTKTEFSTARSDSPDAQQALQTYLEVQAELRCDSPIQDAGHFSKLRSMEKEAGEALRETDAEAAYLATGSSPTFAKMDSIVREIAHEGEVFIIYRLGVGSCVGVLSPQREPVVEELATGGLEEVITGFRAELDLGTYPERRDSLEYLSKARDLYNRLIAPIEGELQGASSITLLPSGALYYLPFGALHTGQHFLLEDYVVRVLPSLTFADLLHPVDEASTSTLVLANPTGDLPHAEEEGRRISQTMPQARLLPGSRATDKQFKEHSRDYTYVHIASHVVFDENDPLESSILLAKTEQTSGEVTVSDLYADVKLNANLVVLSACQTALSRVTAGGEVCGLTQGVLLAGSSAVIGSLWRIEDEATAFLMDKLYRELRRRCRPAEALQRAQVHTYAQHQYRHPFYWAAFQLTGR